MKILQRYILLELLKVFGLLLSVLTVVLLFVGVFQEAQQKGLGADQIIQILPYLIPSLLPYTIPSTLLLSVCVVYGRLAGDQEIIATKSAGINPISLLMPAFMLSVVLAVGSLILADRIIPWSITRMQFTISQALEDIFLDKLRATHLMSDQQQGYTISVVDVQGKTLIHPTFQYTPKGGSPVTLQAQEATFNFDLENEVVILNLKKCHIAANGETSFYVEEEQHSFPLPAHISRVNARHMSLDQIEQELEEMKILHEQRLIKTEIKTAFSLMTGDFQVLAATAQDHSNAATRHEENLRNKMKTERHTRFALSTSCLFFVFLGAPYSISQARKQFLTTFFLCFLPILLLYYPVALLILTLAKNGEIDPSWSMWIPNLILFIAGAVILRRVMQN